MLPFNIARRSNSKTKFFCLRNVLIFSFFAGKLEISASLFKCDKALNQNHFSLVFTRKRKQTKLDLRISFFKCKRHNKSVLILDNSTQKQKLLLLYLIELLLRFFAPQTQCSEEANFNNATEKELLFGFVLLLFCCILVTLFALQHPFVLQQNRINKQKKLSIFYCCSLFALQSTKLEQCAVRFLLLSSVAC